MAILDRLKLNVNLFLRKNKLNSFINLTSADGSAIPMYVARPAGKAKGGIVVIQEIFGVNSHIRSVADGYAAAGYLAVAPSTFNRVKSGVELGYESDDVTKGLELKSAVEALPAPGVMQDIQAAIEFSAQAGKVGVVGFCWGGLLTWRAACTLKGLSAAAPYYGGGMTSDEEINATTSVPVLAHFGAQDQLIPIAGVEKFARANPKVEVHIYPADHGFNCDQRGSYDASSAALARERTLKFFDHYLA
jgi:carboxymethylenebutenolidase